MTNSAAAPVADNIQSRSHNFVLAGPDSYMTAQQGSVECESLVALPLCIPLHPSLFIIYLLIL